MAATCFRWNLPGSRSGCIQKNEEPDSCDRCLINSKGAGPVVGETIKASKTRERKLFHLVFRMGKSTFWVIGAKFRLTIIGSTFLELSYVPGTVLNTEIHPVS